MQARTLPSLTVVIPNHNHGHLIGAQLRSIFAQSVPASRIIIIDDASTDDSVQVIESLIRDRTDVQFIRHSANAGPNARVNEAIALADTDYLAFQSADDEVCEGFFEQSLRLLARFPQAAFCSAITLVKEGSKGWLVPPRGGFPLIAAGYVSPAAVHNALLRADSWMMSNSAVVRRDLLQDVGGFDPRLLSATDEFMWRVLALRHGACFIPEVLAINHAHDKSFSRVSTRSDENMLQIMRAMDERMLELPELFSRKLMSRTRSRMIFRALQPIFENARHRAQRFIVRLDDTYVAVGLSCILAAWAGTAKLLAFLVLRPFDLIGVLHSRFSNPRGVTK